MLDLLIVDDESAARQGLIRCMPWDTLGVRVCGEAINGARALAQVQALRPDIVLTDIRMPFMDGIELCRALRAAGETVKIIFISGYEDLEYFKSALAYDVSGYVLKPVDVQELSALIARVAGEIRDRRSELARMAALDEKLRRTLPALRDRFLTGLLRGEIASEDLASRMADLELNLPPTGQYAVSLAKPGADMPAAALLGEAAHALAQLSGNGIVFSLGQDECAALWWNPLSGAGPAEWADLLRGTFGLDVSIGIGDAVDGLPRVKDSYTSARQALDRADLERKTARERLVGQIRALVLGDLRRNFTIREIAEAVHYSPTYITALFKQDMGQTINEFATQCRMEKARELLDTTSLKAYEVARQVGYQDAKYFSRLYRRHFGVNPSEHR